MNLIKSFKTFKVIQILFLYLIWRLVLEISAIFGKFFIPLKTGFLGPLPWANFDGVHYLSIAKNGYYRYEEAFFPLYPVMLGVLGRLGMLGGFGRFGDTYLWAGLLISNMCLFGSLLVLNRLTKSIWPAIFLLFFPTSFFFGSVYTESLFMLLVLLCFYWGERGEWGKAGVAGGAASLTRFVGIFLFPALVWELYIRIKNPACRLPAGKAGQAGHESRIMDFLYLLIIPLGLLIYVLYLQLYRGDGLAFIHAQPAFGANRSGGQIVLLPQVYWRYLKIFLSANWQTFSTGVSFLEFISFNFMLALLYKGWQLKIKKTYLLFMAGALLAPSLSGTLSSMPRYLITAFPAYLVLAKLSRFARIAVLAVFLLLLFFLSALFGQGYFVS